VKDVLFRFFAVLIQYLTKVLVTVSALVGKLVLLSPVPPFSDRRLRSCQPSSIICTSALNWRRQRTETGSKERSAWQRKWMLWFIRKDCGRIRRCHCTDIGLQTLLYTTESRWNLSLIGSGLSVSVLSTVRNLLLVLKVLPFSGQTSVQCLYVHNILILMQVNLAIVKQPKVVVSM